MKIVLSLPDLLILILATWRLTSLISQEGGPWDIFAKLRKITGVRYNEYDLNPYGTNTFSRAILCPWCLSVWVAGGVLILAYLRIFDPLLTLLALSAGAILIEKYIDRS